MPSRSTLSQCRCTLQISTQEAKVNTVHLHPSLLFSPSSFFSPPSPPPLSTPLYLSCSLCLPLCLPLLCLTQTLPVSTLSLSLSSLSLCLLPSLSLPSYIVLIVRVIRCKSQCVTLISLILFNYLF